MLQSARNDFAIQLPSSTIIIPAYNEEKRIGRVLEEVSDFITKNGLRWNVIVSIDGNDGTEEIVREFSNRHSFITYNKNGSRSGKGYAIKRAVRESSGEFTVMMDADGSIGLMEIVDAMKKYDEYDVILFNRYSRENNSIPILRRLPSRGFNLLVRAFLKINVRDTQCGYKIVRTPMLKEAFSRVAVTNAFFDVDLLYHLKKIGARMVELDAAYVHNNDSKFNVLSLTVGEGVSLVAFRLRHSRFYKYIPQWARDLYWRKFRWI